MQSQSRSLFNTTQSPGWTEQETKILKLALMKFGIGQWTAIVHSGILPGKQITQLSVMTQRVLGQQSLGGLVGLHLDADIVREYNEKRAKTEKNIVVKNGMIINKGNNPTKESKVRENLRYKDLFDLSEKEVAEKVDEFELFSLKRKRRLLFNRTVKRILKKQKIENGLKSKIPMNQISNPADVNALNQSNIIERTQGDAQTNLQKEMQKDNQKNSQKSNQNSLQNESYVQNHEGFQETMLHANSSLMTTHEKSGQNLNHSKSDNVYIGNQIDNQMADNCHHLQILNKSHIHYEEQSQEVGDNKKRKRNGDPRPRDRKRVMIQTKENSKTNLSLNSHSVELNMPLDDPPPSETVEEEDTVEKLKADLEQDHRHLCVLIERLIQLRKKKIEKIDSHK